MQESDSEGCAGQRPKKHGLAQHICMTTLK